MRAILGTVFTVCVLAACGCATKGIDEDPIARARSINKLVKEGQRLYHETSKQMQSDPGSGEIDIDGAIRNMSRASDRFAEARDLSLDSATPRQGLAHAQHTLGLLYMFKRDKILEKVAPYEESGRPIPRGLSEGRDKAHKLSAKHFQRSIAELEYYASYLQRTHPWSEVYVLLETNYAHLEQWDSAAQALERHVEFLGKKLGESQQKTLRGNIDKYRQLDIEQELANER